jgi:hypothetical protein
MNPLTELVAGRNARVVRRAVASLAALALVGVSAGAACQCLMKVTPSHDSACCCSAVGAQTVVVQANQCDLCLRAQTENTVGEALAAPDNAPSSVAPVFVVAVHHAFASGPAPAARVRTPPLILSSSRPILRI